jgi:phosphoribosylaminoimidazole (AIR) synthetase
MFSTFNMGIAFIIIAKSARFLDNFEEQYGYKAEVIGIVDESRKIIIKEKDVVLL